ncbi:MAG: hypothetical protein ACE5MI_07295 [Acidimicrobiia bacterium]
MTAMLQLSQEMSAGEGRIRVDVHGSEPVESALADTTFLDYRLAAVEIRNDVMLPSPDIVWDRDASAKSIEYSDGVMTLQGDWFQGELQKVVVAILALRMEATGLHPFHSSAVRFGDQTLMFLGGESNHGKSMAQIESCRRGALLVSTETTVTDERGWAVMGSKSVFLKKRAKGTERADKASPERGVEIFFGDMPTYGEYNEPADVDLVIVPAIDGNFETSVAEMIPFERQFQTFHGLQNYFLLNELLAPGLPMPLIDNAELRLKRAEFVHRFAERPYYFIRAAGPQALVDEVEKVL